MFRMENDAGVPGNSGSSGSSGSGGNSGQDSGNSSSSESRSREEANTIIFTAKLAVEVSILTREAFLKKGFNQNDASVAAIAVAREVMGGTPNYLQLMNSISKSEEAVANALSETSSKTQKDSTSQVMNVLGIEDEDKAQSPGKEAKVTLSTSAPLSSSGHSAKRGEFDNRQRSLSSLPVTPSGPHEKKRSDSADQHDASLSSGAPSSNVKL